MSTASRLRHPKQPSPESGRPRLLGKTAKPTPLDVTAYQKMLHGLSAKQSTRTVKTHGAFGGVTKDERMVRRARKRFAEGGK
jgi:hypothetical protein